MFERAPARIALRDLVNKSNVSVRVPSGRWQGDERELVDVVVPARPLGMFSLVSRLRLAWSVFSGEADALFWE